MSKLSTQKEAGLGSFLSRIFRKTPSDARAAGALADASRKMQNTYFDLITSRAKSKLAPKYLKEMAEEAQPEIFGNKIKGLEELERAIARQRQNEANKLIMLGGGLIGGGVAGPKVVDRFKQGQAKLATYGTVGMDKEALRNIFNNIFRDSAGRILSNADWAALNPIQKLKYFYRNQPGSGLPWYKGLAARLKGIAPDLKKEYSEGLKFDRYALNSAKEDLGNMWNSDIAQKARGFAGDVKANAWEHITDPVADARNKYLKLLEKSTRDANVESYAEAARKLKGENLGGIDTGAVDMVDDIANQRMAEELARQSRNKAIMWGGGLAGGGMLGANLLGSGGDAERAYLNGQIQGMNRYASVQPKLASGGAKRHGPYPAAQLNAYGEEYGAFAPELDDSILNKAVMNFINSRPNEAMRPILPGRGGRPLPRHPKHKSKLASGGIKVRGANPSPVQQILGAYSEAYGNDKRKAQLDYDENTQAFDRVTGRAGLPVANRTKGARLATKTAGEERGVPDGTGPYGRGDGPGRGMGDGSGMSFSPAEQRVMEDLMRSGETQEQALDMIAMLRKSDGIQDELTDSRLDLGKKILGVQTYKIKPKLATKYAMDYNDYYSMAMGQYPGEQVENPDAMYAQMDMPQYGADDQLYGAEDQYAADDEFGFQQEYPGYGTPAIKGAKLATINPMNAAQAAFSVLPVISDTMISKDRAKATGVDGHIPASEIAGALLTGGPLAFLATKMFAVPTDKELEDQEKHKWLSFLPLVGSIRLSRRLKKIKNDARLSEEQSRIRKMIGMEDDLPYKSAKLATVSTSGIAGTPKNPSADRRTSASQETQSKLSTINTMNNTSPS